MLLFTSIITNTVFADISNLDVDVFQSSRISHKTGEFLLNYSKLFWAHCLSWHSVKWLRVTDVTVVARREKTSIPADLIEIAMYVCINSRGPVSKMGQKLW